MATLGVLVSPCVALAQQQTERAVLRLVAATTAGQTGIIATLTRDFQAQSGTMVDIQYAGALEVLDRARQGQADLIITHHPPSEKIFVAEGYGLLRTLIMYNEFAIFGPPDDALGLARERNLVVALARLANEEVPFMVPGKRSGTHKKLSTLWAAAGIEPEWVGYEITNASAAATLRNAGLFGAYTFADMGTYLVNREYLGGQIVPLFRDNLALRNSYSAIVVSPKRIPNAQQALAEDFLGYLVTDRAQQLIERFGREKFGTQVFTPAAHLDDGLKARRAAIELAEKAGNLRRISALALILALVSLMATWLFARTRKLQRLTRRSEERFALAVSGTNDGIWDWDRKNNSAYFSPRLYELLGYEKNNRLVHDPVRVWKHQIHPNDRKEACKRLEDYLAGSSEGLFVSEYRLRTKTDNYCWVLMRGKAVRDADGEAVRMSGSIADITERKQQQAALEHQALHDSLTGLPNRTLLLDRLQQIIRSASRERESAALIVMDLDRFKEINDTLGHHVGDLLLQQVGNRLQRVLRESDVVVRLGGDEFAVLLPGANQTYATHVAQKILLVLNKAFQMSRHSLHVGGSLGVALYPNHGEDAEALLKHADVAMYIAKRSSSGCAIYDESQDQDSVRRLQLANELHDAIDSGALELHYQPKIDLKTGGVIGAEALLRWQHPRRGMVPPDEMIPIAEHSGLIKPLTMWVLNSALAQCAKWRRNGLDLRVAVNLSVWNMHDPSLVDEIGNKLSRWDVPPSQLELEITESTTMADPERFLEVLEQLDAMGISLAVDDFGTGFSSLGYLKRLPFEIIKIDKSFVINMDRDKDDDTIVRSIVDLAHNLGIKVVAEGVENNEILNRLVALGCDAAQGYYFARPMVAVALARWLTESPWHLPPQRRLSIQ